MVKKLLSNFALLLAMIVAGAGSAWADTTYKLEKVTQVSAGKLYVFEQDGYVMNNTVASSALQTTNTYSTEGLTGSETYVWTLEASNSNFKMVNVYNKANGQSNLLANSSSTTISFNGTGSDWAFNFQSDGTVLIQNTNNSSRFLGFTNSTSHAYKAYDTSNLSKYPHAINVYQLVEEGPADERQEATLNFSSEEVRIALNAAEGDYELPTLNNPANLSVTYTSSNDDIITEVDGAFIVATEAVGEATMTATFAGNDTYKPATAEFKVIIYDPNAKGTKNNPYSVLEVIAMEPSNTSGTSVAGDIWVKGFIVGSYGSNSQPTNVVANFQASNLALADSYDETDSEYIIPVQLVNETEPRINFNPVDKPYNVSVAQVLVRADVFKYFGFPGLKNTSEIEKVAEQVSISDAGMATYFTDCALDLTEFTDMYAYTATVSGSTITFSRVQQVPAEAGVLLRNPAGAAASNVVPVATGTVAAVDGNSFVGTLTDITVDGDDCYILNNSATNGLGFYKVKSSGSKVGAHRAYLKTGTEGVRSFIGFSEGDANGIESVGAEAGQSMEVYNLQGVRVAQPTKGLYIMNGKKVIFK